LFITRAIEGLGDATVSIKYQIYSIIICGSSMWFGITNWGLNGMLTGWMLSSPIVYIYLLGKIANKLDIKLVEVLKMYLPLGACLFFMCVSVLGSLRFMFAELSHIEQLIASSSIGILVFFAAAYLFAQPYVKSVKRVLFSTFKKDAKSSV
jgi:hypothetical protein